MRSFGPGLTWSYRIQSYDEIERLRSPLVSQLPLEIWVASRRTSMGRASRGVDTTPATWDAEAGRPHAEVGEWTSNPTFLSRAPHSVMRRS